MARMRRLVGAQRQARVEGWALEEMRRALVEGWALEEMRRALEGRLVLEGPKAPVREREPDRYHR